ncbi:MAG: hypothetical protein AAGC65_12495 [Mucilaginibacter sp.]|uniref:hypothetical protein n=1 Tax=Mucilaginibacter sp. TaxID=1882438 RepID=UPI0031B3F0DE
MTVEEQINEAITNELSVVAIINSLKDKYGNDVTILIAKIASFATNDTTWSAGDDVWSHKATKDRLSSEYPFLTEASKNKIADIAAYFWK